MNEPRNIQDSEVVNIYDLMDVPRSYFTISEPKLRISTVMRKASEQKGLSLRSMDAELQKLYQEEESSKETPHYNTILQIAQAKNYKINSLLYVLDLLGKDIVIVDRTPEQEAYIQNRGKTAD